MILQSNKIFYKWIGIACVLILFVSCTSSTQENKTSDNTKLNSLGAIANKNCNVEDFYFSSDNKILKKRSVVFGKTLGLRLKGISGFSVHDGKVFCDGSIEILDSNKKQVFLTEDLLSSDYPDGMDENTFAELIELYLYIQPPVKVNERYIVVFRLKDREGPATMEITEDFLIVEKN